MLQDLKSQLGSSMLSMGRFLQRPVTLRIGPQKMSSSEQRAAAKKRLRVSVRYMQSDLKQLLDQHAATRKLMRHLGFIERTLRRGGLPALELVPVRVVAKSLAELESLVWDWSPVGLAELRSRLAVMLKNRPAEEIAENHQLDATQRAIVTEVEHSMFEQSQRHWSGQDEAAGHALVQPTHPAQPA
jgi:hypothetical protein